MDFPPIAQHGVIGDRRTGSLVAADGTLNWFCTPDFDGLPIFGALLDPEHGGFCRFGPDKDILGRQSYLDNTAVLLTSWPDENCTLADVMAWPDDKAPPEGRSQRIILRRLRVTGSRKLRFELRPRRNFTASPETVRELKHGATFTFVDGTLGLWSSFPAEVEASGARASLTGHPGDEFWVMVGWNAQPEEWSVLRARQVFAEAERYWREWSESIRAADGEERASILRRSAMTVQLLSNREHNSSVAALTTSLPERLGGDRNYDYRYAWVRDASLSLALLARLGKTGEVRHYLDWLCKLRPSPKAPLQVCYRLDGNPRLEQEEIAGVRGYADSKPVHCGNRAANQLQLGSLGFLADCMRIYVDHSGEWREEFWQLLKRAADFTCEQWQQKDSGIWELAQEAHYVGSRVMSWVVLERAAYISRVTNCPGETDRWRETAAIIHSEVMNKGWCEEKRAFRQRYESDALDAAALLIPLMRFLPIDHPRVTGTLAAIERELVVNGLVHRFDPTGTIGGKQLPVGEFEGAFLPCVFWHAQTLAKAGRCEEAEAILRKCEAISGPTGLFAEEVDAARDIFLGNTPLLFAHVEYARAVFALNQARTPKPMIES